MVVITPEEIIEADEEMEATIEKTRAELDAIALANM